MRQLIIPLLLISQLTFGQTDKAILADFKNSTCDHDSDPSRLRTRIISKEFNDNMLTVTIATTATCCVDFEPKSFVKNGILYLDYKETGTACECNCCYELTYRVKEITDEIIKIKFRDNDIELTEEKYNTYPIKYRILNGDTINFSDNYGLKQGKWSFFGADSLMNTGHIEFINDVVVKIVKYDKDKKTKSIELKEMGFYVKYTEYFESGKIKKECVSNTPDTSYKEGQCKEWNEKGELVFEGNYRM